MEQAQDGEGGDAEAEGRAVAVLRAAVADQASAGGRHGDGQQVWNGPASTPASQFSPWPRMPALSGTR
jgi:hypothetical protein